MNYGLCWLEILNLTKPADVLCCDRHIALFFDIAMDYM